MARFLNIPRRVHTEHAGFCIGRAALVAAWIGVLCGCGFRGQLAGDVYRDGPVAFRIGALPTPWQRVQVADGELAFHHEAGGTILAHATCTSRGDDVPLDVLTNHLLFGFEDRRELERATFALDGRRALCTRVAATLDGVPMTLDLVVLEKDGCTYDFQLAASPAVFSNREADFRRFVDGFAQLSS